ncbi:MAG: branched-chain amino acid ABC transporter permease [Candidatus Bathyarchaeia archaeon]
MIEPILIFGLINGLIYALVALGFTLAYGISGMVNLAHGVFFVIGAYLYGIFLNYLYPSFSHLAPIPAIILSCIATGLIGSIFYRITLHQLLGDEVGILMTSILGCVILQQLILLTLGREAAILQFSIKPLISGQVRLFNMDIPAGQTVAVLISIIAFTVLAIFISKTKIGRAMRALSQDLESAMLMGVSTEKTFVLTTMISAGLASLAGILYTSTITQGVRSFFWIQALAISFTVVILGGLGSIKGSILGGLIYGIAESAAIRLLPRGGALQQSIPFIVITLALLIMPKGLFGKRIEME